ncbi:hypothetical protein BZA77DRAFT_291853 [Pyronema omphalodes]|nr:hypothetical protein BZA77DRAFT_291853 [Pyronema omphalodes]
MLLIEDSFGEVVEERGVDYYHYRHLLDPNKGYCTCACALGYGYASWLAWVKRKWKRAQSRHAGYSLLVFELQASIFEPGTSSFEHHLHQLHQLHQLQQRTSTNSASITTTATMDTPNSPRLPRDATIPTMSPEDFQKMLENLRQGGGGSSAAVPPCTPPPVHPAPGARGAHPAQGPQGIMSPSPKPWWVPTSSVAAQNLPLPRPHTVTITGSSAAASPSPPPTYTPITSPCDSYIWPSIQSVASSSNPASFTSEHVSCRNTLEQLKTQHTEQIEKLKKEVFQAQVDMWYARDEVAKTKEELAAAKTREALAAAGKDDSGDCQTEILELRERIGELGKERDGTRMEAAGVRKELEGVKRELERARMELGFVKEENVRLGNELEKMVREREIKELEEMVERELRIKKEKEEEERVERIPGAFPPPEMEVFRSAV